MLADVLTFMLGFDDLFGLVLVVLVGFGAVEFLVRLIRGAVGRP